MTSIGIVLNIRIQFKPNHVWLMTLIPSASLHQTNAGDFDLFRIQTWNFIPFHSHTHTKSMEFSFSNEILIFTESFMYRVRHSIKRTQSNLYSKCHWGNYFKLCRLSSDGEDEKKQKKWTHTHISFIYKWNCIIFVCDGIWWFFMVVQIRHTILTV